MADDPAIGIIIGGKFSRISYRDSIAHGLGVGDIDLENDFQS